MSASTASPAAQKLHADALVCDMTFPFSDYGRIELKYQMLERMAASGFDFSRQTIGLLRGFPADAFLGPRVAVLNVDYRFPLVGIERGSGILPIFARTLHASVFADAGQIWSRGAGSRDLKVSAGGELSADVTAGYVQPLTAAVGAAWGRDGHTSVTHVTAYVRLGRAF